MNVKVILNKDISTLGEEGDVKEVARGYARNYLLPRGFALPYTPRVIKLFETRKEEIEARKETKRKDALGIKEKLEELQLNVVMPAGANGKLYGAVTNQTITDELAKSGINVERKRIEIPGNSIKSVGKYKFVVKLYGNAAAEMFVTVQAAEVKTEEVKTHADARRAKHARPAAAEKQASTQNEEAAPETQPSVQVPPQDSASEPLQE